MQRTKLLQYQLFLSFLNFNHPLLSVKCRVPVIFNVVNSNYSRDEVRNETPLLPINLLHWTYRRNL